MHQSGTQSEVIPIKNLKLHGSDTMVTAAALVSRGRRGAGSRAVHVAGGWGLTGGAVHVRGHVQVAHEEAIHGAWQPLVNDPNLHTSLLRALPLHAAMHSTAQPTSQCNDEAQ